ncbi:hypothetical protein JTE90_013717 [Oedothorax gibbosus]|uniref:Small ribosomal subunit protein mS29 n=1 Tax=Oedothorax gibbosus TaxID=931172 RepID=A0AAV6V039_9ARAC|nr:hypothetical protein JTE90_013717 [Oedothorax gibbosus]
MAHYTSKLKALPMLLRFQNKCIINTSTLCTKQALDVIQDATSTQLRTSESNPTLHTRNHHGKFYMIPEDVKSKLFFCGGIPRSLDIQMKSFHETVLMVREPALEVMSYLKKINYSNPAVRFVIYGRHGTGKTTTLAHLLHYGFASRYLLVHLPWVSIWTKRPKEVVASQYNEQRIDLPVESAIWLQHFKQQNSELLQQIDLKTTKSYSWSKREVTEQGEPLINVIEHGIQRVRHASDCVAVLLKEIKIHSASGKFKALVLVDGVNAFWCKTNVKRPDRSLVPPSEITITRAFMKMLQNDWNNAAVIASVDVLPANRDYTMLDPYTPRVLLGKEGFELLDPFIPIETEQYTEKEIDSQLDYYCDRLWIQSERGRSEEGRKIIKFLSGYNPYHVMQLCDPL